MFCHTRGMPMQHTNQPVFETDGAKSYKKRAKRLGALIFFKKMKFVGGLCLARQHMTMSISVGLLKIRWWNAELFFVDGAEVGWTCKTAHLADFGDVILL